MELVILQRRKVFLFRKNYQIAKRILDVSLCLLALPFIAPVMAFSALLIMLDDGRPIFFKQLRTGKGGKRFMVHKFRTMVRNAEELKDQVAHLNNLAWPDFKASRDPRITRVGLILRKTSIDELPQIINVLKGEMSLVGPRPSSFDVGAYDLRHTARLEVLPGITGLAQISGRSKLGFDEKLVLDIEYVKRQSLWLDILIILRTLAVIFYELGE